MKEPNKSSSSWNLKIYEDQFEKLFPKMVKYKHIFKRDFKTDEEFINQYLVSKLWRLNNIYTIVDKHGEAIPFKMNYA